MLKVLIVDDHPNFRHILRTKLSQLLPLIVEEAATGQEALEKIDVFLPHLIFMDIDLPDTNGLQFTREIKARHPGISIAVMTGHKGPGYQELAAHFGADRFFPKDSIDWNEVTAFVRSVASGNSENS
jgi:DNA-binding NarL/FixJ family response regulator